MTPRPRLGTVGLEGIFFVFFSSIVFSSVLHFMQLEWILRLDIGAPEALSNSNNHQNHLESWWKPRSCHSYSFWDNPTPRISELVSPRGDTGVCLYDKFPVMVVLLVPGDTWWQHQLQCLPSTFPLLFSFPTVAARHLPPGQPTWSISTLGNGCLSKL